MTQRVWKQEVDFRPGPCGCDQPDIKKWTAPGHETLQCVHCGWNTFGRLAESFRRVTAAQHKVAMSVTDLADSYYRSRAQMDKIKEKLDA